MNCSFCCDDHFSKIKINHKQILKILDILIDADIKRICYSGGDPLLSPYLEGCMARTYRAGIENVICTSDGELLKKLKIPKEYFYDLRLSIHGLSKDHPKATNVPSSFSNLENAVDKLKNKYPLSATCVLRPELLPKLDDYVQWCVKNNFNKIYFTNLLRSGSGESYINLNGRVSAEDFKNVVSDLQKIYSDQIRIIPHPFETNAECIIIYGNGDVYINPCYGEAGNKLKIGNVLDESPQDIFKRFKANTSLWQDYSDRMSRSTLILEKAHVD